ncbi:MAG TPA: RNA-binding S4 domain-containing protein [Solirubrobacteraceae bacterium]|jgi:ribosome-associated protein
MREIAITGEVIRLGQLLKIAGLVDSGAHAKELLANETVTVNGHSEQRRGRQLHRGDVVLVSGQELQVL